MLSEIPSEVQGSSREKLIQTAVNFLNNPEVNPVSATKKENFLRKKGLTVEEIRIAFERSNGNSANVPIKDEAHIIHPIQSMTAKMTWFQTFKDIVIVVGASYGLYHIYKTFIAPFLRHHLREQKSIESSINDINETMKKSIDELTGNINKVCTELERVSLAQAEQQNYFREIGQLKSEIATVKGILLSRHQFPSVSLSTTSIPAWQLTSSTHKDDKEILENEDVEHNSGSSEPEIAPVSNRNGGSQGSDSSLEMIKEVDG